MDQAIQARLKKRDEELKQLTQSGSRPEAAASSAPTTGGAGALRNRPIVLAETAPFLHPYKAFTAAVRTIPPRVPHDAGESHQTLAFLVHGTDSRKSFTPLVSLFSPELNCRVLFVPESHRGDFLFLIVSLNPGEGLEIRDGELVPVELHVF